MGLDQREIAYKCLLRIYKTEAFSNIALSEQSAFVRRLVLGCIERKKTLEYIISRFARKAPDNDVALLLHTGIYQIMYMDIPDSAACDETTDIAKRIFGKNISGFANAIMRSACRAKDDIMTKIERSGDNIKYSLDNSICSMIRQSYPEQADEIMSSFFGEKRLFARVNTIKTDALHVADLICGEAIDKTTVECFDSALAVRHMDSGDYFIQGIGSQTAVKWLAAEPGMTVADVCACPGGKTFGAAIDMQADGVIYCSDIRQSKLPLIKKGAAKLGVDKCISVSLRDARTTDESLAGKCDRVICDVPCTALGEIISRPEIRYKDISRQSSLYLTQQSILEASARLVKRGGRMVYSTCTLDKRENEDNIDTFLCKNSDFALLDSHLFMPHADGCGEGFYIALITRR